MQNDEWTQPIASIHLQKWENLMLTHRAVVLAQSDTMKTHIVFLHQNHVQPVRSIFQSIYPPFQHTIIIGNILKDLTQTVNEHPFNATIPSKYKTARIFEVDMSLSPQFSGIAATSFQNMTTRQYISLRTRNASPRGAPKGLSGYSQHVFGDVAERSFGGYFGGTPESAKSDFKQEFAGFLGKSGRFPSSNRNGLRQSTSRRQQVWGGDICIRSRHEKNVRAGGTSFHWRYLECIWTSSREEYPEDLKLKTAKTIWQPRILLREYSEQSRGRKTKNG